MMFPIHICMISEHIPAPLPGEVTDRPLRSCSPPPNIKGGFYSPPAVHYEDGANVTFTCDERRTLMGNATIACLGGLWHPATPVCRMNREFIKQCSSIWNRYAVCYVAMLRIPNRTSSYVIVLFSAESELLPRTTCVKAFTHYTQNCKDCF